MSRRNRRCILNWILSGCVGFFIILRVNDDRETVSNAVATLSEKTVKEDILEQIKIPNSMEQTDPRLIDVIRSSFLHPPSYSSPHNLTLQQGGTRLVGENGQPAIVDRMLKGKRNGFFVEAGAFDGEYLSNSLFFERRRNWTGLLIEPDARAFQKLLVKSRRANSVHCALCLGQSPEEVIFEAADVFGGVVTEGENDAVGRNGSVSKLRDSVPKEMRGRDKIQCFPLFSLLLALGNPTVDYFSLDVEGAELAILQAIPFDKVNIRILSVEVIHSNAEAIVRHLVRNGFKVARRMTNDIIFKKAFN